jgi:hypothetical protein
MQSNEKYAYHAKKIIFSGNSARKNNNTTKTCTAPATKPPFDLLQFLIGIYTVPTIATGKIITRVTGRPKSFVDFKKLFIV